jgi:hypothetical protein
MRMRYDHREKHRELPRTFNVTAEQYHYLRYAAAMLLPMGACGEFSKDGEFTLFGMKLQIVTPISAL